MDTRPGGKWRFGTRKTNLNVNGVNQFFCEGEVLEFDPPRVLAYTWIANWHDDKSRRTIVRWELTPTKDGTHVKVTHSGLAQEAVARKDYSGGWPGVVEMLKKFVEKKGGLMATIEITPDQDTVVAEIFIAAPPERVFQAITDPAQTSQWWGQKGVYRITERHADFRPGGKYWSVGVGADGTSFRVEANIWRSIPRACWCKPGSRVGAR